MATGRCVRRPVIAAGPADSFFVVYENDMGIDRLGLEGRMLRIK